MKGFRDLKVWAKSHALTLAVYRLTAKFPRSELFGLASQLRRAASAIPANIAEGCGRHSDPDFARFLDIAMGSASELEYQLLLARDLNLISPSDHERLTAETVEVKRMLATLIKRVRSDQPSAINRQPPATRPRASAAVRTQQLFPDSREPAVSHSQLTADR